MNQKCKKILELKIIITEGWQEISCVTRLCDSPPFSSASGHLFSDYCFFISRWAHRSDFWLGDRVNLFSASFSVLIALLEPIKHFDIQHVFYAFLCCMHVDCICKKVQVHCWRMYVSQWFWGKSVMKRSMTFP